MMLFFLYLYSLANSFRQRITFDITFSFDCFIKTEFCAYILHSFLETQNYCNGPQLKMNKKKKKKTFPSSLIIP